jgi:ABC-2 type transport system ATP-binding protein
MTRQLIKELGKERTILLSTHVLPEVSMTCERVIIINEGKIVAEDRIENLSSAIGGAKRIRLEIAGPSKQVTQRLRQVGGVLQVRYDGSQYIIECSAGQDPRGKIMEAIVQSGWTLLSMEFIEMSLEDIFLKLTTKEETSQ